MIIYINGRFFPLSEVRISPLDYGFMYGFSLFETLKSYDGRLFRLPEHLSRLREGAAYLEISKIPDDAGMERAIRETLRANNLKDARIRLTLSIGEGTLTPDTHSCQQPTLMVAAAHFTSPGDDIYGKGYRAIISGYRRDSLSPLSKIKTGNYLASLLARTEARQKGAEEALLLNERGSLSECSTANIFIVKNKRIITPDEKSGILSGITRQEVLKICLQSGDDVEEREVRPEELFQADEAFITNSLLEIMPLTEINGHTLGKGFCGDITKKLHSAYRDKVNQESI